MTAYAETNAGIVFPRSSVSESTRGRDVMIELLESRLQQLELEMAEQGWSRIDRESGSEFSRDMLGNLIDLARTMYLKNPIINRAVEIAALYVFGQDIKLKADNELVKAVIDRFWKDNRGTLTGQQASRLLEVELEVTGNVFLALFPQATTGQLYVRGVPVEEIKRIITNPDDRTDVWYYLREWSEVAAPGATPVTKKALYPDWRHKSKEEKPPEFVKMDGADVPVLWTSPIVHVRAGAFGHWRWGIPEVYAALDWARAYKEQLEDDATRSKALARFAWRLTTDGGKPAVDAAKARLQTTLGVGNRIDTNPPPVAGSTFVGDKSIGMSPISIAGSTLDPDHSRPARLMAAAALGIPDHFFDADVGNYATSKTLDRPTELRFSERRQMWRDFFMELCQYAIDTDLGSTGGLLKAITETDRQIDLTWPDLLEPDVTARVTAVNTAAPYLPEELTARLMMTALNVEDIEGELAKLSAEKEQAQKRAAELAAQQAKAAQQQPPPGQQPPVSAKEAALTEVDDNGVLTLSDVLGIIDWWKGAVPAKYAGLLDATIVPENPNA